jgi:hypothetical protein
MTLTETQAVSFGKCKGRQLVLHGLRRLTDFQAKQPSNGSSDLHLGGLEKITDRQAESLGGCRYLELSGLTELSEAAAAHLGNVFVLHLGGTYALSESQAKHLRRCLRVIKSEAKNTANK